MQAAHISNLQRGVVPNVLDSLYLGLSPEQRVKEASINSFKATFVAVEKHCGPRQKRFRQVHESAVSALEPSLCNTVDLIHQTSHCN